MLRIESSLRARLLRQKLLLMLAFCCPGVWAWGHGSESVPENEFQDVTGLFAESNVCFSYSVQFNSLPVVKNGKQVENLRYAWEFGDPAAGSANESSLVSPTHEFSGPGVYPVSLVVTDGWGMKWRERKVIEINSLPIIVGVDDTLCPESSGKLKTVSTPGFTVVWFEDALTSVVFHSGAELQTPSLSETKIYYAAMQSIEGCVSERIAVHAFVRMQPQLAFESNIHVAEMNVTQVSFRAMTDQPVKVWKWDFGDGEFASRQNTVHYYRRTGFYTVGVTIEDEWGCTYHSEKENYIEVKETGKLFVPNIFTPNGDNTNDDFITPSAEITEFSIQIFDRAGLLVFESKDLNFSWNGKNLSNQDAGEGVYTWVIRAHTADGTAVNRTGSVMLAR